MTKASNILFCFAVLLLFIMCAVVGYEYCDMKWAIQYRGASAPQSVAFLYAIPFVFVSGAVSFAAWRLRKRGK